MAAMKCRLGRNREEPCSRKQSGHGDDCLGCNDAQDEREGILQYGQGTGGSPEKPTCRTHAEAVKMAQEQARESMRKAGW